MSTVCNEYKEFIKLLKKQEEQTSNIQQLSLHGQVQTSFCDLNKVAAYLFPLI